MHYDKECQTLHPKLIGICDGQKERNIYCGESRGENFDSNPKSILTISALSVTYDSTSFSSAERGMHSIAAQEV